MKHILYIHHGGGLGGAPLSLLYLLQQLDRSRYEPIVLTLRPALDSVFSYRALQQRGLFNPAEAQRLYQSFLQGEGPYMRVWCLAALELWLRKFVD